VFLNFKYTKEGKYENAISLSEPGYSQEKSAKGFTNSAQLKKIMEPFSEIVFLSKMYFGPYIRISYAMKEVLPDNNKGRGFPGSLYLKKINNKYMIVQDELESRIFELIANYYDGAKIIEKENITLNPDMSKMKQVALDVDGNSPPEKKIIIRHYPVSGVKETTLPAGFSKDYLLLYLKCEPSNVELSVDKPQNNLSKEHAFMQSAMTAYAQRDENRLLSFWADKSQVWIKRLIDSVKSQNRWPKEFYLPFGNKIIVTAMHRSDQATTIYFKDAVYPSGRASSLALINDSSGRMRLSDMVYVGDSRYSILSDDLIEQVIPILYGIAKK
jgi:hypothetical protein